MTFAAKYLEKWFPNPGWGTTLRDALERCSRAPAAASSIPGWLDLVMMIGDSRGAPLCLITALYARTLALTPDQRARLDSHIHLCLLDLGLVADPGEPIPLLELGAGGVVDSAEGKLSVWLRHELEPFDGDLARGASFCLHLAALRTEQITGPTEPTIAQLTDAARWTFKDQG